MCFHSYTEGYVENRPRHGTRKPQKPLCANKNGAERTCFGGETELAVDDDDGGGGKGRAGQGRVMAGPVVRSAGGIDGGR